MIQNEDFGWDLIRIKLFFLCKKKKSLHILLINQSFCSFHVSKSSEVKQTKREKKSEIKQ